MWVHVFLSIEDRPEADVDLDIRGTRVSGKRKVKRRRKGNRPKQHLKKRTFEMDADAEATGRRNDRRQQLVQGKAHRRWRGRFMGEERKRLLSLKRSQGKTSTSMPAEDDDEKNLRNGKESAAIVTRKATKTSSSIEAATAKRRGNGNLRVLNFNLTHRSFLFILLCHRPQLPYSSLGPWRCRRGSILHKRGLPTCSSCRERRNHVQQVCGL